MESSIKGGEHPKESQAETPIDLDPGRGRLREGERRTVTVLFSDMKGFTTLSERLDPEEMDALMNRVFSRFESIVKSRGGSVEKYIGDALVAVFGYPALHEDDPIRAVECALEFGESIATAAEAEAEAAGKKRGGSGGEAVPRAPILTFRTGIHTGVVATGKRGGQEVVTGHAMAIAARLESKAPDGGILVSEPVRERCGRRFRFGDRIELAVKGKDDSVIAFLVQGRGTTGSTWDTPFVGREAELGALSSAYLATLRGGSGGIYILGDAGIGKTRLCAEFRERLRTYPTWQAPFVIVNPTRTGRHPWEVATGVLRALLAPGGCEAGGLELETLAARAHIPEDAEGDLASLVWHGGEGLPRARIGSLLGELLSAGLTPGEGGWPAVLVLDNAEGIDRESLTFFRDYLAAGRRPLFPILVDRREDEVVALAFGSVPRLSVEGLPYEEAAALVRLVDPDAPAAGVEVIIQRSQGNPLCLEEFAKLLRKAPDRALGEIPESVQNAILASTEALGGPQRQLLRQTSVLVRNFSSSEAAELLALAGAPFDGDIEAALANLAAERFLAEEADGTWRFRHSLLRESIYESLLNQNKQLLNGAAARLYSRVKPGWKIDIFRHLVQGPNREEAGDYLIRERPHLSIGQLSLIDELIASTAEERPERLAELLYLKSATCYNNHHPEGAEEVAPRIYGLAIRSRDQRSLARAFQVQAIICKRRFDYRGAVHFGRRAFGIFRELGDLRGECFLRGLVSESLAYLGDWRGAEETLEGIPRDKPFADIYFLSGKSGLAWLQGDYRSARRLAEDSIRVAEGLGLVEYVTLARIEHVLHAIQDFDYDAVLAEAEGGMDGSLEALPACTLHRTIYLACSRRGLVEKANESRKAALAALELVREEPEHSESASELAKAFLYAGDASGARLLAEDHLPSALGKGGWNAAFELCVTIAEAAREAAKTSSAPEAFAFFIGEAFHFAPETRLLPRPTEIRYLYLSCLPSALRPVGAGPALVAPSMAASRIQRALSLLDEELAALSSEAARQELLALSVFGELAILRAESKIARTG